MPDPTVGQSERSQKNVEIGVYYRVSLTVEHAEKIVGRPWTAADEEDDSWTCELEEAVKDHLPDLLAYATDDPDVEWHG